MRFSVPIKTLEEMKEFARKSDKGECYLHVQRHFERDGDFDFQVVCVKLKKKEASQ